MPQFKAWTFNPLMMKNGGIAISNATLTAANAWAVATKGPTLRLYKNDPPIVDGMSPSDFEECDFTGYAAVDMSGGALVPFVGPNGNGLLVDATEDFVEDAPGTIVGPVFGAYLTNNDGTEVWGAGRIDIVFQMVETDDRLEVTVQIPFPSWGPVTAP